MNKHVLTLCLASAIALSGGVSGFAEKEGQENKHDSAKGKGAVVEHEVTLPRKGVKGGAQVEHRLELPGHAEHNGKGHAEVRSHEKQEKPASLTKHDKTEHHHQGKPTWVKEKNEVKDDRKESRKEAIEERKEAFKDAQDRFKDSRQFRSDERKRTILVQGRPIDQDRLLLFNIPGHRDAYLRILEENDSRDDNFFTRIRTYFAPRNFTVGKTISESRLGQIKLLPLSVNSQLDLPEDGSVRVGVVGNQLVLLDMDRALVLDVLALDKNGQLIVTDIDIPDERLFRVRLDDSDEARVKAYLVTHPDIVPRYGLIDRLRYDFLAPIGLGERAVIGEFLSSDTGIVYLPTSLATQIGLPGTDLRLGLFGDDLVLIDPQTALVMDVAPDII